jgi:hypothetical protein
MIDQITLEAIAKLEAATTFIEHEVALGFATWAHMDRGRVLPLTAQERSNRMLYLAGELPLSVLDNSIDKRSDAVLALPGYMDPEHDGIIFCAEGFYLLSEHNGGKDPRRPDPFDRWRKPGSTFVNRTADCQGGQSWAGGFDRFQPTRFSHIYRGWINTDSMIMDALGPQKCFVPLDQPEDGCFVVCATGTPGHEKCGHIGGIPKAPAGGFDRKDPKHWAALGVVDVASRGKSRANKRTTARGWFGTGALFVRSVMTP